MHTKRLGILLTVFGLSLVAPAAHAEALSESGWYDLELTGQRMMTVKILETSGDAFVCLFQGSSLRIPKNGIRAMRPVAEDRGKRASAASPAGLTGKDRVAVLDALEDMASRNPEVRNQAVHVVKERFPAARQIAHEALKDPRKNLRRSVAKFLGDAGDMDEDLAVLVALLRDPDPTARVVAMKSVRLLGPGPVDPVVEYIRWEPVANNRKIALKTLERWGDVKAIAPLAEILENETDRGARKFTARALKALIEKDLAGTRGVSSPSRGQEVSTSQPPEDTTE